MRIWSLHSKHIWDLLKEQKVLKADSRRLNNRESFFRLPYKWLISEMDQRIARPEGVRVSTPWWGWKNHIFGGRPDLRRQDIQHYVLKGETGVRIELEIPDDEIVLTDFHLWEEVLSFHLLEYIPERDDVDDAWDKWSDSHDLEISEAFGFTSRFGRLNWEFVKDFDWASATPQQLSIYKRYLDSFQEIFKVNEDHCIDGKRYFTRAEDRPVQGTFWLLKLDQVVDVTEFTRRR